MGIAHRMLQTLEDRARELGFTGIRLETGAAQPEALSFYGKYGYKAMERFGPYIDCELSLCFEKLL